VKKRTWTLKSRAAGATNRRKPLHRNDLRRCGPGPRIVSPYVATTYDTKEKKKKDSSKPLDNADNYVIMINMTKEQALKGYKIVDFRPPRKGETILMCNNQSQFSVGKVSRGNKIIWAYILEKDK
jgi:hypothetical protein